MCQSSVWARYPDGRTEKIADDVLIAVQNGEAVMLRWFLKDSARVIGTIQEVNAIKHVIILNVPEVFVRPDKTYEAPDSRPDHEQAHVHPHPH